jgi:acetoin utilization deacetylase AcuC-like enzyme
MKTLVLWHEDHVLHEEPAGHPEARTRIANALSALVALGSRAEIRRSIYLPDIGTVMLAHSKEYVRSILGLRGTEALLDDDTFLRAGSTDAALSAAGTGIDLVDHILDGRAKNGFALLRPPGHHATRDAAGGFCIFNNIAIAAEHARRRGISRVLILDWDVHHGNGTQSIFLARPDVMFVDFHQDDLLPDGGYTTDIGVGPGLGCTLNLPLPSGCNDADYLHAAERLLLEVARIYQPELVLVSCGFDAHVGDPLGGMDLSTEGFAALTTCVLEIAERWAASRLAMFLEGGYELSTIGPCVRRVVEVLAGGRAQIDPSRAASPLVRGIVESVLRHHEGLRSTR